MRRAVTKPVFALVLVLTLLAACSTPDDLTALAPKRSTETPTETLLNTTATYSACSTLYSGSRTSAVVDPAISYGQTGTLILSFNSASALAPATKLLSSKLGLSQGKGLGVFKALPMIAVKTSVTRSLVGTLTSSLKPYGLLSIYQDKPLRYFLNASANYIKAPAARSTFKVTGKGVGVAVIDSGIDGTQGDFAGVVKNIKIVAPITGVGASGALYIDTPNSDLTSGHGTHVAGTIGGTGAKSNGRYTGIAPGAKLVGIGAGDAISILYALEGFDFALNPTNRETYNIRVISNSWGSSGTFAPYNPISLASKRAYDLGVVVNFAAGNEGPGANTLNPYSASPCVISVAAGDKSGYLADFSSRGVSGSSLVHPDITAPGVDIIASRATTGPITPPYEGDAQYGAFYSQISGTSMATPHISGVVALMLEANPKLNLDGVLKIMSSTARPMYYRSTPDNGVDPQRGQVKRRALWEVGAGYVDAYASVQGAARSAGSRVTTTTKTLASWSGSVDLAAATPVGTLVEAEDSYTLKVPTNVTALRVTTDWSNPALDLDLYVYAPNGQLIGSSAQGASASESVALPKPVAGSYNVVLEGYLNTPTNYKGTAQIDTASR